MLRRRRLAALVAVLAFLVATTAGTPLHRWIPRALQHPIAAMGYPDGWNDGH